MTTAGTAELVSTVIEKARRLIAQNVKPVNNGIRCAQCERTKRQILGHFDGEGGCTMGDLADAGAAYDAWESGVAESVDASFAADCGWCGVNHLAVNVEDRTVGEDGSEVYTAPCPTDGCKAVLSRTFEPVLA